MPTAIGPGVFIGWTQGAQREQVQDIGQQQFLMMLLFVIAAELDQFNGRNIVLHERRHRAVDMVAIGMNSFERRAGEHARLGRG